MDSKKTGYGILKVLLLVSSSACGSSMTNGFLHLGHGTFFPTALSFFSFRVLLQLGHWISIGLGIVSLFEKMCV